jgi:hypothetical protein
MTADDTRATYAAALKPPRTARCAARAICRTGPSEPPNASDFTRLATVHTFGDAWPRTGVLDLQTREAGLITVSSGILWALLARRPSPTAISETPTAEMLPAGSPHRGRAHAPTSSN